MRVLAEASIWEVAAPWAAAAVTVIAVLVGTSRQARFERQSWNREKRLTVYSAFLAAADDFQSKLVSAYMDHQSAPNHDKPIFELPDANELRRAFVELELLGPPAVADAAQAWKEAMTFTGHALYLKRMQRKHLDEVPEDDPLSELLAGDSKAFVDRMVTLRRKMLDAATKQLQTLA